jgi:aminoglycoside phosphotransferase (APT) family kinase protein
METATMIWEFDTAVWRQRLTRTGSGYELTRRYREAIGSAALTGACIAPSASVGHARFVTGSPVTEGEWTFTVVGEHQFATQLWPTVHPVFLTGQGLQSMTDVGRLLATLHKATPRPPAGTVSPHVQRLRAHLTAPVGPAETVLETLPRGTVNALQSISLSMSEGRHVACHGGFSLGSLFADDDHRHVDVVVGPELCSGPPELDLGWMVGELTEFEFTAQNSTGAVSSTLFTHAAQALVDGYQAESGHRLDRALLDDVVAARIALHLFDFVTTTGRAGHLAALVPFVTWLTDRRQAPASPE